MHAGARLPGEALGHNTRQGVSALVCISLKIGRHLFMMFGLQCVHLLHMFKVVGEPQEMEYVCAAQDAWATGTASNTSKQENVIRSQQTPNETSGIVRHSKKDRD